MDSNFTVSVSEFEFWDEIDQSKALYQSSYEDNTPAIKKTSPKKVRFLENIYDQEKLKLIREKSKEIRDEIFSLKHKISAKDREIEKLDRAECNLLDFIQTNRIPGKIECNKISYEPEVNNIYEDEISRLKTSIEEEKQMCLKIQEQIQKQEELISEELKGDFFKKYEQKRYKIQKKNLKKEKTILRKIQEIEENMEKEQDTFERTMEELDKEHSKNTETIKNLQEELRKAKMIISTNPSKIMPSLSGYLKNMTESRLQRSSRPRTTTAQLTRPNLTPKPVPSSRNISPINK